jgi:hypothetical protein
MATRITVSGPKPAAAPAHHVSLEAAKEMIGRHVDAVLDQMAPAAALHLVEWLKDDAAGRFFEMDDSAGWPQ